MDKQKAIEEMAKDLKGCITVDGRVLNTVDEIRSCLNRCKAKGYRVLPMHDCKGFDFEHGCPGHATKEECDEHDAICKIARAICEEENDCPHWCGVHTECKAYQDAIKIYEERKT